MNSSFSLRALAAPSFLHRHNISCYFADGNPVVGDTATFFRRQTFRSRGVCGIVVCRTRKRAAIAVLIKLMETVPRFWQKNSAFRSGCDWFFSLGLSNRGPIDRVRSDHIGVTNKMEDPGMFHKVNHFTKSSNNPLSARMRRVSPDILPLRKHDAVRQLENSVPQQDTARRTLHGRVARGSPVGAASVANQRVFHTATRPTARVPARCGVPA